MKVFYEVETLRSGQPRPYANTEREYRITVKREVDWGTDKGKIQPWLMLGDIESRILKEEAARKAGTMSGGQTPDELRKYQREWAIKIAQVLCQKFYESEKDEGACWASPILRTLKLDASAGTIYVFIVEAYTD